MTLSRRFSLLASLLVFLCGALSLHADTPKPNFVFILIDDLGWSDLHCYGSEFHETPNIDRLASQGMKFTQAYSACCVCSPTRAAILTGKYPATLHVTDYIPGEKHPHAKLLPPDWTQHLPLNEITIAQRLKSAGYVTASIGKWHLGGPEFVPQKFGFDINIAGDHKGTPPSYFSPYNNPQLPDGRKGEFLPERLTAEAIKFMEKNKERPFFLYLPHFAVHTPIQPKPNVEKKYRKKLKPGLTQNDPAYAALVEAADDSVGRIMDALKRLKLADRTVVIFTSDNGGLTWKTSNAPLREGKATAYEGGVRVPLIVRWPGVVKAGSTCETPVISMDFYPTMLEIAGLANDTNQALHGESILPLLRQAGSIRQRELYWHYPHYHRAGATPYGAVRDGDFKLIQFYETGRFELYNLKNDLGETKNLVNDYPKKVGELNKKLDLWRKTFDAQMPLPNPNFDPVKAAEKMKRK